METPKISEVPVRVYCPKFDWKRAADVARGSTAIKAGAHASALAVSLLPKQAAKDEVLYTAIGPKAIDDTYVTMDSKAVVLEVKIGRDASTDPGYFPAGMTSADFYALSVVTAEGATRTSVAIIVGHDIAAVKVLSKVTSGDTLRIRGIARIPRDRRMLAIVVDTAELVER